MSALKVSNFHKKYSFWFAFPIYIFVTVPKYLHYCTAATDPSYCNHTQSRGRGSTLKYNLLLFGLFDIYLEQKLVKPNDRYHKGLGHDQALHPAEDSQLQGHWHIKGQILYKIKSGEAHRPEGIKCKMRVYWSGSHHPGPSEICLLRGQ